MYHNITVLNFYSFANLFSAEKPNPNTYFTEQQEIGGLALVFIHIFFRKRFFSVLRVDTAVDQRHRKALNEAYFPWADLMFYSAPLMFSDIRR